MYINLVLYYYQVHWYSTVLLARCWVKYCIFALYIKCRRCLHRSDQDAQPPPPLLSYRRSQRRQQRRQRCHGILLAASATSVTSGIAPPSSVAAVSLSVAVDAFLLPPLPLQPLRSRRIRSASPLSHPLPRKTLSLPVFGLMSGVVVGRGSFSDSSSPLSSAGAGAGIGVVVATGRSDKSSKLELSKSRTKIPYDKLVFQVF